MLVVSVHSFSSLIQLSSCTLQCLESATPNVSLNLNNIKSEVPSLSSLRLTRSKCKTWAYFLNSPAKASQIFPAAHSLPPPLLSAVRSLDGDVDDLECFHHLFLPGGWRSVQSKKAFSHVISASVLNENVFWQNEFWKCKNKAVGILLLLLSINPQKRPNPTMIWSYSQILSVTQYCFPWNYLKLSKSHSEVLY